MEVPAGDPPEGRDGGIGEAAAAVQHRRPFRGRQCGRGRAGAPAFHCDDRVLTYGDVQDLTNRTATLLRDLGVEMEGRVLVLCLDAPEFLGTFWGAIKIGAVPIPVNTLMRSADTSIS